MKSPKLPLSGTLLFSYAVYSTFVPVSISHSIIIFSLAGFAAFQYYIDSHKTPSTLQEVARVRTELLEELQTSKEYYELKLAELKQELSRQAIERANASASGPATKKPAIKF
jgi:hypothetical protein